MSATGNAPARRVRLVNGLSAVAAGRELLICDIWGVIHNGVRAFQDSCEALARFRAGGGAVVLVSNAPRPSALVRDMLDRLGAPREAYDGIVTSGDITRSAIAERAGRPVFMIGPARDRPVFDGLDVRFAPAEEADYVVCTGLFDDENETAETYRPVLEGLLARDVELVCANPDLVVERGDRLIPCAGAIAALYARMGGRVIYAGKPHAPVYEAAFAFGERLKNGPIPRRAMLAIGDSIHTDVAGAVGMGVDVLFVARGVHAHEVMIGGTLDQAAVDAWAAAQKVVPTAFIDHLRW
ncbi:TIGR01459 family HAD-type hydrolase [Camelimonas abortus]|uniref:TIGR01459 family HAD-type hydrolase n=1 Tax=Camelimonas abortus TaxID=1017184 RepID=A0ABV7LFY7_9HYPH